jgi:hypothetical protein
MEDWKIIVGELQYTVRNPIADYFAYQFRSPSGIKPKDKDKLIMLGKLMQSVKTEGEKIGIDYFSQKYFAPWEEFINKIRITSDPLIVTKKVLMSAYWLSIGEYIAHGRGLAKTLLSLHNKFTGKSNGQAANFLPHKD